MITKDFFISEIKKYEETAFRMAEFEFTTAMKRIERESLDEDHKKHMISIFIYNVNTRFDKLTNFYKATLERFEDLKSLNENVKLNKDDRVDFIATVFIGYIEWQPEDKEGIETKLEFVNQIKRLHTIVPETYSLKLTKDYARDFLKKCLSTYKNLDSPKRNYKSNPPSLRWNNVDHSELNEIHKSLKDHGYLNCNLSELKRIFSKNNNFTKIKWLKPENSLIYFYGQLIDKSKIKAPKAKWKTLHNFFDIQVDARSAASIYSDFKNETKTFPNKTFFDKLIK